MKTFPLLVLKLADVIGCSGWPLGRSTGRAATVVSDQCSTADDFYRTYRARPSALLVLCIFRNSPRCLVSPLFSYRVSQLILALATS